MIDRSLPNAIVYEDGKFLVFLDKYPINYGHTLIVPKDHFNTILEMPSNLVGEMHSLVPHIAKAIITTIDGNGFNISQNNGRSANQIIPHVHVHIVPRFAQEKIKGQWPMRKIANIEELKNLAEKIIANLNIS
ncbi:MAG: HIT family protein [Thermoproteota archaeon]|nr:HIT family protein [Thermoproteota archaeon]